MRADSKNASPPSLPLLSPSLSSRSRHLFSSYGTLSHNPWLWDSSYFHCKPAWKIWKAKAFHAGQEFNSTFEPELPDSCLLPLTSNVNSRPVLPLQESQPRKGHGVKFEHTFGGAHACPPCFDLRSYQGQMCWRTRNGLSLSAFKKLLGKSSGRG